jgi:L-arabinokinase
VFADIPALAFDIAARLGVPRVGMTNFSWDWIYEDYVQDVGAFAPVVADLRRSYGHATQLLRLPFHGDLSAFPHIRDIPLVARTAHLASAEVRHRLNLPTGDRVVLLSFGGIGTAITETPEAPAGVTYVATQSAAPTDPPPGCRFISNADMARVGVRYEDLVAASDAVITKPGYGIVSDCIANGTPMIYTSRGRFREYPCLVDGIRTHLAHAFISNEELYAGRWRAALDAVFAQPRRQAALDCTGAAVAADILRGYLS